MLTTGVWEHAMRETLVKNVASGVRAQPCRDHAERECPGRYLPSPKAADVLERSDSRASQCMCEECLHRNGLNAMQPIGRSIHLGNPSCPTS